MVAGDVAGYVATRVRLRQTDAARPPARPPVGRRRSRDQRGVNIVAVVDVAPFVVFLLVGAVAGRFLPGSAAWLLALFPPVAHFGLSVLTGRAGDDLLSYVLPVNLLLLGLAILGLLGGRALRRRTHPVSH